MKKADIWIPIYIGDLLADTQHLTNEQLGIYHKFIYHQWRHGHFSEEDLYGLAGFSESGYESASSTTQVELKQGSSRVLAAIKKLLSKDQDGLWFSRRCDVEKEKWTHKKEVFTERARKGGLAKNKRRRELIAKEAAENHASSTASSVLTNVLESCTSSSDKEQKQKLTPPTPSASQRGIEATRVLQAAGEHGQDQTAGSSPTQPIRKKSETGDSGPRSRPGNPQTGIAASKGDQRAGRQAERITPGVSNGVRPQKTDPRFEGFQTEIFAFWRDQNPDAGECPWSDPGDRALSMLLHDSPQLSLPAFRKLLKHRATSDVNPAAVPAKWIRKIAEFSAGPLDRFHKPLRSRTL